MPFRIMLWVLGMGLALASRLSKRFRSQITRAVIVELRSDDGVARHFRFKDRRVSSRAGSSPEADCAMVFDTAWNAVRTFLSFNVNAKLFDRFLDESVRTEGRVPILVWFGLLVMSLIPFRQRVRLPKTPPNAYLEPHSSPEVEPFITREPSVKELDPEWTEAHIQREKLLFMRTHKGEAPPLF